MPCKRFKTHHPIDLHSTSKTGGVDALKEYINEKINNKLNASQMTPLHDAVKSNKPQIVQLLLELKAKVNERNVEGKTPLHLAFKFCRYSIASQLLNHGADPNLLDEDGNAAFHENCDWLICSDEVAKTVLNRVPDFNLEGKRGLSVFFLALRFGSSALVKKMLESNVDVNARRSADNKMSLHHVLDVHKMADEATLMEKLVHLISRGADVNAIDDYEKTPLDYAVGLRFKAAVEYLLKSGANVDGCASGKPPILKAIANEDAATVGCLIDHGAKIDWIFGDRDNALHVAIKSVKKPEARLKIVRLLQEKGVTGINRKNKDNQTPLKLAIETGDEKLLKLLFRYESPKFLSFWLSKMVTYHFYGVAKALIEMGASVDAANAYLDKNILLMAVYDGRMVELLLDHASDKLVDYELIETLFFDDDEYLCDRLIKHIVLASLHRSTISLMTSISIPDDESPITPGMKLYEACLRELKTMRSTTICDGGASTTTYFDLLTKRGNDLRTCLRRGDVRRTLESAEYGRMFKHYAGEIERRSSEVFQRFAMREELVSRLGEIFFDALRIAVPCEVIREIVEYLSEDELSVAFG